MPTEQNSPVSRRKLGIFAVTALVAALLVVVSGIRAREDSSARLREWTDNQAVPTVAVFLRFQKHFISGLAIGAVK